MFCSNCGKEVADGIKFCPYCGQEIGAKPKSENGFAAIAKKASEAKKKVSEKLDEANKKDEENEKFKIDPALGDNKDWQSVEEIIAQKKDSIFELQGVKNTLLGTTDFKLRKDIANSKSVGLANKVAQKKIFPSDIVAVYDNKNEGKIVFTDYAMYASEKMMLPIVVKYADITEVGINRENSEQAIVRLSNGLEWTITNNNHVDMKAFAEIIKTLSDFAKKRGEDEKSKSIVSSAEQEATNLLKIIGLLLFSAIFCWNSYTIFHNISMGIGIGWTIIAIIVNIGLLYPLVRFAVIFIEGIIKNSDFVEKLISKKVIWAFPLTLFILFGAKGCSAVKNELATTAENLINENSYYEVDKVTNIKKISKGVYSGTAVLDNGKLLSVTMTISDGEIFCEWK